MAVQQEIEAIRNRVKKISINGVIDCREDLHPFVLNVFRLYAYSKSLTLLERKVPADRRFKEQTYVYSRDGERVHFAPEKRDRNQIVVKGDKFMLKMSNYYKADFALLLLRELMSERLVTLRIETIDLLDSVNDRLSAVVRCSYGALEEVSARSGLKGFGTKATVESVEKRLQGIKSFFNKFGYDGCIVDYLDSSIWFTILVQFYGMIEIGSLEFKRELNRGYIPFNKYFSDAYNVKSNFTKYPSRDVHAVEFNFKPFAEIEEFI